MQQHNIKQHSITLLIIKILSITFSVICRRKNKLHDIGKKKDLKKCKPRQSQVVTNGSSNFIHLHKYIIIKSCHVIQGRMTLWHCANTAQHTHADAHLLEDDICQTNANLPSTSMLQNNPLSCFYCSSINAYQPIWPGKIKSSDNSAQITLPSTQKCGRKTVMHFKCKKETLCPSTVRYKIHRQLTELVPHLGRLPTLHQDSNVAGIPHLNPYARDNSRKGVY